MSAITLEQARRFYAGLVPWHLGERDLPTINRTRKEHLRQAGSIGLKPMLDGHDHIKDFNVILRDRLWHAATR